MIKVNLETAHIIPLKPSTFLQQTTENLRGQAM